MESVKTAMNTIPSIFNNNYLHYTVIGDNNKIDKNAKYRVCVVVLNRGQRLLKEEQFSALSDLDVAQIISVEPPESFLGASAMAKKFKKLSFIVPATPISQGDGINIAVEEAKCPYILVIWNNMRVALTALSNSVLERSHEHNDVVTAAILYNRFGDILPTSFEPTFFKKKRLNVIKVVPSMEHPQTLIPYDYCGLYNRRLFKQLGGFDSSFKTPYWQLLDFGMRCYMWGHHIRFDNQLRFDFQSELEPLDETVNQDYPLFYLKNLAVKIKKGQAILPKWAYISYKKMIHGSRINDSVTYPLVKEWVNYYKQVFIREATDVVYSWESWVDE